jgi:hypothetical protein
MKASIRIILFAIFLANIVNCKAQQDSIKLKVINYLICKGQLEKTNNNRDYIQNIFIVNMAQKNTNENKAEDYLFKIGAFSSHGFDYLMIKNGENYEFIDVKNLDEALLHFIRVSRDNNRSSEDILKNVEAIITIYQRNSKAIPWTN